MGRSQQDFIFSLLGNPQASAAVKEASRAAAEATSASLHQQPLAVMELLCRASPYRVSSESFGHRDLKSEGVRKCRGG